MIARETWRSLQSILFTSPFLFYHGKTTDVQCVCKVEAALLWVSALAGFPFTVFQIIDFGSSDNLRYGCPQCGRRFKEPRYVSQHMVINQEPHLECTSCGRRFRWLTSLRNHRIACHREGMLAEQASTMTRPVGDALERVQQAHDSDNP